MIILVWWKERGKPVAFCPSHYSGPSEIVGSTPPSPSKDVSILVAFVRPTLSCYDENQSVHARA